MTVKALSEVLKEAGIARVVVIDDAFDPPTADLFADDELETLAAEIEGSPEAQAQIERLGLTLGQVRDPAPEVLKVLIEVTADPMREFVSRTLLPVVAPIRDQLNQFLATLGALPLTIERVGSNPQNAVPDCEILFIDLYLGREPDAAIRRATDLARKLYTESAEKAPLFVLMSSHPNLQERADQFRRESSLLRGMFHVAHKDELKDGVTLHLRLRALAAARGMGTVLHRFTGNLKDKLSAANEKLLEYMHELSLADFWFLQRLALLNDGHPMGDYLLSLLSTFHGHLAFSEQFAEIRKAMDELVLTKYSSSNSEPSVNLARIYTCALVDESVGKLTPHPHDVDGTRAHLHLGDLFLNKDGKGVLAVINAECDLAFSPLGERTAGARTVLFLPGELVPISDPIRAGDAIRTELFERDGKLYRIVWDALAPTAPSMESVLAWLKEKDFERVARLRLGPALALQRAFASTLTRVGMPVPPPVFASLTCQFFAARPETTKVGDSVAGAFYAWSGRAKYIVLTQDGVAKIREAYLHEIDERERAANALEADKRGNALQKFAKFKAVAEKPEAWAPLLDPLPMKDEAKATRLEELGILLSPASPKGTLGKDDFLFVHYALSAAIAEQVAQDGAPE